MTYVIGAVRFTASKAGKTGLTTTGMVTVYRVAKDLSAHDVVVTAGNAVEIGNGLYAYAYSASNTQDYVYYAVFTTADATVDDKQPAVWLADPAEQAVLAASLTGLPADVWAYTPRTLTNATSGGETAPTTAVMTYLRGDTWAITITDLGNLTDRVELWFTLKRATGGVPATELADSYASLQITESGGLIRLNGEEASESTLASITVTDETDGDLRIDVKADATKELAVGTYSYDVQVQYSELVTTLVRGAFIVQADITRAIS